MGTCGEYRDEIEADEEHEVGEDDAHARHGPERSTVAVRPPQPPQPQGRDHRLVAARVNACDRRRHHHTLDNDAGASHWGRAHPPDARGRAHPPDTTRIWRDVTIGARRAWITAAGE
jgi:hypothetical protein